MAKRAPIHPGEILLDEFLIEFGVTSYALAKAIGVPTNRVTGIVKWRTLNHCRYGAEVGEVFRKLPEVLDESANAL